MTEKTGYKRTIKFSQSLTTGTIGFEGSFSFDDKEDFEKEKQWLVTMLEEIETTFDKKGYKIATFVPTNAEKNTVIKSGKQESKELANK